MKPRFTERSERKSVAEFDPAPRYLYSSFSKNWVQGSGQAVSALKLRIKESLE
jgi:hypothetical protein